MEDDRRKRGMSKKKTRKVLIKRMRKYLNRYVIAVTLVMAMLLGNIVRINIKHGKEYSEAIQQMRMSDSKTIPYKRGDILDCNGTILATDKMLYKVILEPKNILEKDKYKEPTRKAVKEYFGVTDEQFDEALRNENSYYYPVVRDVEAQKVKDFKEFCNTPEGNNVVGVNFELRYDRFYPNNELACHVLGYTVEDNGLVGYGGLEGEYNSVLAGENGRSYSYTKSDGSVAYETEAPKDGNTLVTSIDVEVQRIVQENVEEYNKELKAKNISVLVMDPNTGEILALYNSHQYDCNNPYDYGATRYQYATMTDAEFAEHRKNVSDEEMIAALNKLWRNFTVSDAFEPGSTYKTFTISGALDDAVITPNTTFECGGSLMVDGWPYPIYCHNHEGHGTVDVGSALASSCNVSLMHIAAMEGSETFDKYQKMFGFGQYTGIDLQGEESAIIYDKENLGPVELATSSFGQGVTVTMIQIGTAFCSVINGGYYYQPHIVKQVLDSNGNVVKNYDKILVRRTISEATSKQMRKMLQGVVENGTGWRVKQEGYEIGGKTGTAEKFKEGSSERDDGKYILSFIGFAPVDNPQVVIYVTVNEPGDGLADYSPASTETFRRISEDLFPYLNIYKSTDTDEIDRKEEETEQSQEQSTESTEASDTEEETESDESSDTEEETESDEASESEEDTESDESSDEEE